MNEVENLKKLISEGKVKDKWYFYKRTLEQVYNLLEDMKSTELYFKNKLHLDIYLIYGTLLGALREKDFILHDNDVDLAYISKCFTKEAVKKEFEDLCQTLDKEKLLAKVCGFGHLHIWSPNLRSKLDFWTSAIIENQYYLVPTLNNEVQDKDCIPLTTIEFKGISFNIPKNSVKILNILYKNWQTPQILKWRNASIKKIL